MKIRAKITFADGVPASTEDFYTFEIANLWAVVMLGLYPGSTAEISQLCDEHGEEDMSNCSDCAYSVCAEQAARTLLSHDEVVCAACAHARAVDAEAEYDPRPPVAADRPERLT